MGIRKYIFTTILGVIVIILGVIVVLFASLVLGKKTNENKETAPIVFLGDSITQQFPTHEYYPHLFVINKGVSGDTTDDILKRLKKDVLDLKPSKVFILAGVNDLYKTNKTTKEIAENIKKVSVLIRKKNKRAKIYILSVYPVKQETSNKRVSEINNILSQIDENIAIYIDVNSYLKDNQTGLNAKYTYDGLHLNSQGYDAVYKTLLPYLEK